MVLPLIIGVVLAAPQDPIALGNEAALIGGAVTALPGASAAHWYNPAGIAGASRSVDVSASAFSVRWLRAPGALSLSTPGRTETADLSSVEIGSVPSAVTATRPLGDTLTLGLGLFVPLREVFLLDSRLDLQPDATAYAARLRLHDARTRYHAGPGLGWALTPSLRVGAALFAVFEERRALFETFGGLDGGPDARGALYVREVHDAETLGVQATLGAQWDVTPALTVGLTLRSPTPVLTDRRSAAREVRLTLLTPGPGDVAEVREEAPVAAAAELLTPARAHLGVAWALTPALRVALEGDYTLPLEDAARRIDTAAMLNGRAGVLWSASPTLAVGAGAFTDFGGDPTPERLGDVQLDAVGATTGVQWGTHYDLRDGGALEVGTTLGLRYVYGRGEVAGARIDPQAVALAAGAQSVATTVSAHALSLHLGSSFHF